MTWNIQCALFHHRIVEQRNLKVVDDIRSWMSIIELVIFLDIVLILDCNLLQGLQRQKIRWKLFVNLKPEKFTINMNIFKMEPYPASFWFIFGLFRRIITIFPTYLMWKNVHPVYGAGISTHNLQNKSLIP